MFLLLLFLSIFTLVLYDFKHFWQFWIPRLTDLYGGKKRKEKRRKILKMIFKLLGGIRMCRGLLGGFHIIILFQEFAEYLLLKFHLLWIDYHFKFNYSFLKTSLRNIASTVHKFQGAWLERCARSMSLNGSFGSVVTGFRIDI